MKIALFLISLFSLQTYAIEMNGLGVFGTIGQAQLYGGYDDLSIDPFSFSLGAHFNREKSYYGQVEIHHFAGEHQKKEFESDALSISIGNNFYQFDSLSLSGFGGLGFYRLKATRLVNGSYVEIDPQTVMGINLGVESFLKLNQNFGFSMRYQYHNPFDASVDQGGGDLTGHYTMLTIGLNYFL